MSKLQAFHDEVFFWWQLCRVNLIFNPTLITLLTLMPNPNLKLGTKIFKKHFFLYNLASFNFAAGLSTGKSVSSASTARLVTINVNLHSHNKG